MLVIDWIRFGDCAIYRNNWTCALMIGVKLSVRYGLITDGDRFRFIVVCLTNIPEYNELS